MLLHFIFMKFAHKRNINQSNTEIYICCHYDISEEKIECLCFMMFSFLTIKEPFQTAADGNFYFVIQRKQALNFHGESSIKTYFL